MLAEATRSRVGSPAATLGDVKRRRRALVAVATVLLLIALALWARELVPVDRCLDAGGRWNAASRACEF